MSERKNILEREKSMYSGPEINEGYLINSPFHQYGLSRTFFPPPALAEVSLPSDAIFLPVSLPSRIVVTGIFKQGCNLMGLSFRRPVVLVYRRWAGLGEGWWV